MKNWKTTLIGVAVAAVNVAANGARPAQLGLSAGLFLLGVFSQDAKKSKPAK